MKFPFENFSWGLFGIMPHQAADLSWLLCHGEEFENHDVTPIPINPAILGIFTTEITLISDTSSTSSHSQDTPTTLSPSTPPQISSPNKHVADDLQHPSQAI
jgi:hypothetical protein